MYEYGPHPDPQLVWTGKAENTSFEVPTVSLHIHERIAPEAVIRSIRREPAQFDLFAKPDMPLKELVEFYQHDMDWTNRLILGDSLLVMNSLLEREMMGGKVQTIFVDPPYGVKFSSNFQPSVKQRDVKDSDEFMVREPEQIKAYRDTWELGIHSYLSYLRDRLLLSRDLLTDSGSIFVQIGDENVHFVRNLTDEIFGRDNFVSEIVFRKKLMPLGSSTLETMNDYLLWYAQDKTLLKYRQLYLQNDVQGKSDWCYYELPSGSRHRMTIDEINNHRLLPKEARIYKLFYQKPPTYSEQNNFPIVFKGGETIYPPKNWCWVTNKEGMERLIKLNRLEKSGSTLSYVLYLDDFPYMKRTNLWDDVMGAQNKQYVVQTSEKVVERCILMTTDPGDLVLDPTCGSGTAAYVAEQWGRRWITCDTSRVALTLARQRLMTAVYPYYKIADEEMGVKGGFVYAEVPHITLKSIVNNEPVEKEILFDKPEVDKKRIRVAGPFTVEGIPQLYGLDLPM